jgi:hypothetical protein
MCVNVFIRWMKSRLFLTKVFLWIKDGLTPLLCWIMRTVWRLGSPARRYLFSISVTTGAHETFDQASLTVYVKTRWLTDSCNVHTVSKRDVHQHHFVFFTCDASSSCTLNLFHLLLHHNFFVYFSSSLFTSLSSSCAKYSTSTLILLPREGKQPEWLSRL